MPEDVGGDSRHHTMAVQTTQLPRASICDCTSREITACYWFTTRWLPDGHGWPVMVSECFTQAWRKWEWEAETVVISGWIWLMASVVKSGSGGHHVIVGLLLRCWHQFFSFRSTSLINEKQPWWPPSLLWGAVDRKYICCITIQETITATNVLYTTPYPWLCPCDLL